MRVIDLALFHWLNAAADMPHWVIQAAILVSDYLPGVAFMALFGAGVTQPRWRRAIAIALLSAALAWLMVQACRWAFPMPRPAQWGVGRQWIEHGVTPSFPSMHSSGAFAVAAGLLFARCRPLAWLALPVAGLIALSRVFLGVHFPSDVAAGFVVGCLAAAGACWLWPKVEGWRQKRSVAQA